MVGYSKDIEGLDTADYMISGASAGVVTRFICQPLDVIKIRFQLQVEPVWKGSNKSKYRSNIQAAKTIYNEEGIKGLWKGHNPGQILSILYGVGQVYRSMSEGIINMLKHEGPTSLFKGMTPTLLQVAPHAGAQFATYHLFTSLVSLVPITVGEDNRLNMSGSMIAGSMAGLVSKTVVYPFDLTRKRLEFQGFQQARQGYGQNFWCEGMVHCFIKTYSKEGLAGLFKGLSPSLVKAGVTSALHFTVYEQTCRFIARIKSQKS